MNACIDVSGILFESIPDHPPHFSMRLHTFSGKSHSRPDDKISLQPSPQKVTFILVKPHVRSGTFNDIFLVLRAVLTRARPCDVAYIVVVFKFSQLRILRRGLMHAREYREQQYGETSW
jgi:hypothetical protein